VTVLGHGGLPPSGVASVVLRVGLVSPDSTTSLKVWPAGGVRPSASVPAPVSGQTTSLITVPVSANGVISLQHAAGMSQITVDLVGYHASIGP
jgi:hypothetical protein